MKQVKMNFYVLCQGLLRVFLRNISGQYVILKHSSQGMWILCSCVGCWTQKDMKTRLKLSYSDLASHCVSVQSQELLLDLFLAKQNCCKCLQASSWGSAYSSFETSSSSLLTDPKAFCIPVLQMSLCQALQNWNSALLKFVGVLYLCSRSETDTRAPRHFFTSLWQRSDNTEAGTVTLCPSSGCIGGGQHVSSIFLLTFSLQDWEQQDSLSLSPQTGWERGRTATPFFLWEKGSHGGPTTWPQSLQKPGVQSARILQSQKSGATGEGDSFLLQAVASMTVPVLSLTERPKRVSWEELMFLEWLKTWSTLLSMP